jgi:hydroxysqualene synthase
VARLNTMEDVLLGRAEAGSPSALRLRASLAETGVTPRHSTDLLVAFRQDATKLRYTNWDELEDYCRYSAMPVGRFMLDVHGEDRATWAASDALCAALQINNHLQDCGKDYRDLDRVYVPLDALAAAGASVEMLGADRASPQLLQCLQALARRTELLLGESRSLACEVKDTRLGLEISVIDTFADKIVNLLKVRDPLSERVHLSKQQMLGYALSAMACGLFRRVTGQASTVRHASGGA